MEYIIKSRIHFMGNCVSPNVVSLLYIMECRIKYGLLETAPVSSLDPVPLFFELLLFYKLHCQNCSFQNSHKPQWDLNLSPTLCLTSFRVFKPQRFWSQDENHVYKTMNHLYIHGSTTLLFLNMYINIKVVLMFIVSIRWILWITHEYAPPPQCVEIFSLPL